MNDITNVFNYGAHEVRTVINDGEPWFVAKDIAEVLGYSNTAKAVLTHIDSDDKTEIPFWDGRQNRNQIVINESGLYSLILRSKLEGARKFKRWITHEVIPSIRKTGGYVANDELFINTYLPFADDQTKLLFSTTLETVRKQNEIITVMKPKVEQHDRFISADNLQTLDQVAKTLGIGRNKMCAFLKAVEVFMQRGTSPVPYQRFINDGYFKVKQTPSMASN